LGSAKTALTGEEIIGDRAHFQGKLDGSGGAAKERCDLSRVSQALDEFGDG
jgi:hypothetical protein